MKNNYFILLVTLATIVSNQVAYCQGTPIDLRLETIKAEARKAFGIKNDIATQRATSRTETNSVISDLKEQLRNSRARIDKDIEDLKKIIFADL